jgi:hypothetical protein
MPKFDLLACLYVLPAYFACVPPLLLDEASAVPREADTTPSAPSLQVLEIERLEKSPMQGTFRLRVSNDAPTPALLGVDVRTEPGMWLVPISQKTHLYWLPPSGERSLAIDYTFTRLSPEARLRVRVGAPEEHTDGWVHVPEPVAVRTYDLGGSPDAGAFIDRFDVERTAHLEVYALRGMFDHGELTALARRREHAVAELARLLQVTPPPRMRLVLYPDAAAKTADTHHIGNGYVTGTTIIEIFNDSIQLDPYHEIAHLVAGQLGWPPAWLNEGLAVFASEHLGADALGQLGSAGKSADHASCEFARAGELLPFSQLVRLDDIGPEGTRPRLSYAQAASFIGFLVRRHGMARLGEAYATLSAAGTHEVNEAAFLRVFGVSLEQAGDDWLAGIEKMCP